MLDCRNCNGFLKVIISGEQKSQTQTLEVSVLLDVFTLN